MPMHLFLHRTDSCGSNDSQAKTGFDEVLIVSLDALLALLSIFALYNFHMQVGSENLVLHWAIYLGYTLTLAEGVIGLIQCATDDSFCSFQCLFEYLQLILFLPCYASELWLKSQETPAIMRHVIAAVGLAPAAAFTILEFKSPLLTDLVNVLASGCLIFMGSKSGDYLAIGVVVVFLASYYLLKRSDVVCDDPFDIFNGAVSLCVILSMMSLGIIMPFGSEGGSSAQA